MIFVALKRKTFFECFDLIGERCRIGDPDWGSDGAELHSWGKLL
jgi:hypothetical protein